MPIFGAKSRSLKDFSPIQDELNITGDNLKKNDNNNDEEIKLKHSNILNELNTDNKTKVFSSKKLESMYFSNSNLYYLNNFKNIPSRFITNSENNENTNSKFNSDLKTRKKHKIFDRFFPSYQFETNPRDL